MQFEKHYVSGQPYWFCGIYKISKYTWHRGAESKPHYRAYYLIDKNWGDSVIPQEHGYHKQDNKYTFDECVKYCKEHAKNYTPSARQLKQAEIAKNKWITELREAGLLKYGGAGNPESNAVARAPILAIN